MSKRSFKRKATKGVFDSNMTLVRLFTHGKHEAKYPNHIIIDGLVRKGLITRDNATLDLTPHGVAYIKNRYPNLVSFSEKVVCHCGGEDGSHYDGCTVKSEEEK